MSRDGSRHHDVTDVVLAINALGASASAMFAIVGVVQPDYHTPASPPHTFLDRFWPASSAVRTLAVSGVLVLGITRGQRPAPQLLAVAGMIQLGDAGLGLRQRNLPMAVLPALMGSVHFATARLLQHDSHVYGRV